MLIRESFKDFPIDIDTKIDVSEVEQRIDIVLRLANDLTPPVIGDGIEGLLPHNLFTFKSYQESLTVESIEELIGYTVGYKKKEAPEGSDQLPREKVKLFALVTRSPEKIFNNPIYRLPRLQSQGYTI